MTDSVPVVEQLTPYTNFSYEEWARLRAGLPLPLSAGDVRSLRSFNDALSLDDVANIYLPLTRLLQLYIAAAHHLHDNTHIFLGKPENNVPYVIGVAGSVAVGKSTTARILQALLAHGPGKPCVDLVTTDGFLYPNHVLEQRGIMHRKGFPESYNRRRLLQFMADVKSGLPELAVPIYSHLTYDILPDQFQVVDQPDILIVEGLNVLQRSSDNPVRTPQVFVSDFFDFSIYVHAEEHHLQQWYTDRFLRLRETAFRDEASYFRRYADLSSDEAVEIAERIWREINGANLQINIEPTRERAHLILEKGHHHSLERVRLRKL